MHGIADELGSTGLYFMSGCHKSKVCSQSWGVYVSGRVHLSMHESLGLVSSITHKKLCRYVYTVTSILKTRRRSTYYLPSASIFQISIFQNSLSHPTPGTSIPCFKYEVGKKPASGSPKPTLISEPEQNQEWIREKSFQIPLLDFAFIIMLVGASLNTKRGDYQSSSNITC